MKFEVVDVETLTVDRRYQRELDETRVEKIATGFNPRLLGTLEVSRRNGKCAVFDGQHRLAALRQIKMDSAPCIVHEDLSAQQEADLFVALQRERRNITPLARFRARVFAGDQDARKLKRIVEKCGYRIGDWDGQRAIRAITALENIYQRGGEPAVVAMLEVVELWAGDPKATSGHLLAGVDLLLTQYGDRMDDRARQNLAEVSPTVIIRRAATTAGGGGKGAASAVAAELRRIAGVRGRPTVRPKGLA